MDNPSSQSKDIIKSRLEKIKETAQIQSSSIATISSSIQTNTILSASEIINHKANEEMRNTFKQELNNPANNTKEKFAYFVQHANEMFKNYEKEISHLKQQLIAYPKKKLVYSKAKQTIEITVGPSRLEQFNYKIKNMTEEGVSLDELRIVYNQKLAEIFKENTHLQTMIDKLSFEVINKLQEKIQELSDLLHKEKRDKDKAENQLNSMDSVFQQNSDMKASLAEKDKLIVSYYNQVKECNKQVEEHKAELKVKEEMISVLQETLEAKDVKITDLASLNEQYKISITKHSSILAQKNSDIKEKEEEIQILFADNVQWEEKYKTQSKEMENFKKWSLWDDDIIGAYNKIEILQADITAKEKELSEIIIKVEALTKSNEEMTVDITTKSKSIEELRTNNDDLIMQKINYEKEMEKYNDYDTIMKNNVSLTKELNDTIDKYESQMIGERRNFDKQIVQMKSNHENEIYSKKGQYEKSITDKENTIKELDSKLSLSKTEFKDASGQLEKKTLMLTNLKEVYDNMVKKFKIQEEKIQMLEKGSISSNNQIISSTECRTEVHPGPKVYSTFDTYAFTKELLVDYLLCLYLLESSISMQHLVDSLLGNINTYLSTIFQKQSNPMSILSELLEEIFFIAYEKILTKRIKTSTPEDHSYTISFEDFDRATINEICQDVLNHNPLSKYKPKKTLEQLETMFINKYENSFDFDIDFQEFLTEAIFPVVHERIEKYNSIIIDDIQTLVEMSLNNIKNGKVILNEVDIYSYENYYNENKNIESFHRENELLLNGGLKSSEGIDNIAHRIKTTQPLEVCFINCFTQSSEMSLSKIFSSLAIYSPKINSLSFKKNALSGSFFQNKVYKLIHLLKDLKVLDLSSNGLTDDDFKVLSEELKVNKSIETVIIDDNKLTQTSGYYLADVLIKNKTIITFTFNNNKLNDSGLGTLLQVLMNQNITVKHLGIGANNLSKDDYVALGDYLSSNPVLHTLDISGNSIDPQSANVLGVSFKKDKNLRVLKANMIELNEISSPQFFNFLNESNISEIELGKNIFGDSACMIFLNKIKTCLELRKVSLISCNISPIFLALIGQTVRTNTTLEEINLENNAFEDDGSLIGFCKMIEANTHVKIIFTKKSLPEKAIDTMKTMGNIVLV